MNSLNIKDVILFLVGFINSSFGFLILLKNIKDKTNIYYALTTLSAAGWSLGLVAFRLTTDPSIAISWAKFYYVCAVLIGTFFLSFSFVFPFYKEKPNIINKLLFFIFTATVLIITIWPMGMIEKIETRPWGKEAILTKLYYIYTTYFIMCMIGAFGNFIQKHRHTKDKLQKTQIKYVFIGTIIAATWGTIFNLILPLIGSYQLIWIGPYLTLVMIGLIAFAILKHHLMEVKVITTEIFSILVSLVLLVNALLSKSTNDFILNFSLFGAIAFFSILLIRSVLKEVKTRERLAELTEELQKANEDLKKLDKAKSEFISIASHQLRTPMSIVKGFVSMLLEGSYGQLQEKQKDILNKIYASNDRLTSLINDLLDLSRMEGGRMQFRWEAVAFDDMASSVVEELKPAADKKGLGFKWTNEIQGKIYVKADKEKLRQVLMNLIDNAIKYTPDGSIGIKLVKTPDGKARLSVKDTGIGMDKEELPVLFGKFVRGKKTQQLWTEGTGLGLYVARKIIEEHKGSIWAESEGEGKGSTFYVELPVY